MSDRILDRDTRYVYGTLCTWHDTIWKAGRTGPVKMVIYGRNISSPGLPCCPFCGSTLMENRTKEDYFAEAEEFDKEHAGYLKALIWSQGKCFKDMRALLDGYNKEHEDKLIYSEMFKHD